MNVLLIVIIILVPLMIGVAIGVWYSRKIRKNVDTDKENPAESGREKNAGYRRILPNTNKDTDRDTNTRIAKGFEELLSIMKERQEKELAQERDEELVRASKEILKNIPPARNPVKQSVDYGDRPANVKANIAIPFNLSNMDKQILEDFYNDKPNDNSRRLY